MRLCMALWIESAVARMLTRDVRYRLHKSETVSDGIVETIGVS